MGAPVATQPATLPVCGSEAGNTRHNAFPLGSFLGVFKQARPQHGSGAVPGTPMPIGASVTPTP